MATSNVDIRVGSSFDAKGFKQAETAVSKLTKNVKFAAGALGLALSARAAVNFGKSVVNAFMEDQKAAVQLSNTIKNLGLSFANTDIQKFVEQLSLATGVVDDELRPAMQRFLQTTGSVAKSQELLKKAIDISRGSGTDLSTVVLDLSNAYVGNNKGLKKYTLGLSAAELKVADFNTVLAAFNKNFQGASAAYLETYAGKMERLTAAANEAKEKLGGALIDFATLATGSQNIDDLISKLNTLTSTVVGFFDKLGEGIGIVKAVINSNRFNMNENIQKVQVQAYNQKLKRSYMDAWKGVEIPKTPKELAAQKAAEAAAAKRAKELKAAIDKQTKALKDQAAIKKAQSVFDQKNIELAAALQNKLTEDEQNRVKALLAINNDNAAAASYYSELVLKAQDRTGTLSKMLNDLSTGVKNPFDSWLVTLEKIQSTLNTLPTGSGTYASAASLASNPAVLNPDLYNSIPQISPPNYQATVLSPELYVYLDGKQITATVQNNALNGNTSTINRAAGNFGG